MLESELQLQLCEAQFLADEHQAFASASPLRDSIKGDAMQFRYESVNPVRQPAVVQSQMDDEALLEDEVEVDVYNNSPVRKMGRLRRLETSAEDMEADDGLTDSKPHLESKPAIKKRLVVKATELPEEFMEMEADKEEGEEGEDEEDDGFWGNEEDEYEKMILAANDGGVVSPDEKRKKKKNKKEKAEKRHDEVEEGEESGSSGSSEGEDEDLMEEEAGGGEAMDEQRRLREEAARDRIGKGFVPEIRPLGDLLAKIKSRSMAVIEKAQATHQPRAVTPPPPPPPVEIDIDSLLERVRQKKAAAYSANPGRRGGGGGGEGSDDDDELEITDMPSAMKKTPGKEPRPSVGGEEDFDLEHPNLDPNLLIEEERPRLPDLKTLDQVIPKRVDESHAQPQKVTAAALGIFHKPPAVAGRLSRFNAMQAALRPNKELPVSESLKLDLSQALVASVNEVSAGKVTEDRGDEEEQEQEEEEEEESIAPEGEEMEAGEDEDEEGEEDEGEVDEGEDESSEEESEVEEGEEEEGLVEEMAEDEPMIFEEEEAEAALVAEAESPGRKKRALADLSHDVGPLALPLAQGKSKKHKMSRHSRFIETEAELSDGEDGMGADVSEDEDEPDVDEDGMLMELIDEVKEKKKDQSKRLEVHQKWQEEQDKRETRAIMNGIKNGFNRGRNGPDEEEDDTDAEARRRRAALFADDNDDVQVDILPGQVDEVEEREDLDETEYRKQQHEAKKRQMKVMGAGGGALSAFGDPQVQESLAAIQAAVVIDSTASEVMALMTKSSSQQLNLHQGSGGGGGSGKVTVGPSIPVGGNRGMGGLKIFGKDLTNKGLLAASSSLDLGLQGSSFVGRTAVSSMHKAASNGASRSYVFATDNSSSLVGEGERSRGGEGGHGKGQKPTSFAGIKETIAGKLPQQPRRETPSLFSLLGKSK